MLPWKPLVWGSKEMIAVWLKDCSIIQLHRLVIITKLYWSWCSLLLSSAMACPNLPPSSRRKAACNVSFEESNKTGLCLSLTEHLIRESQHSCRDYLISWRKGESKCCLDLQSLLWAKILQRELFCWSEVSRGPLKKVPKENVHISLSWRLK